ncbi:MAG: putative ABC transport system ATP-binding protein [Candidatus Azotimanducaceae bacterium]|jgi:putative ABC transport system ATP-binding protein
MGEAKNPALSIEQLRFSYNEDPLLHINSFQLQPRERVAVIGPSGCGKTTLMHLISGLVKPPQGQIELQGTKIAGLKEWEVDRLRGREIGIVYQRPHLFPSISILNNLLITQKLSRNPQDKNAAFALLKRLGIADFAHKRPSQVSQGQAQRSSCLVTYLRPTVLDYW